MNSQSSGARYQEWIAAMAAQQAMPLDINNYHASLGMLNAQTNAYKPAGWSQADPGPRYFSIDPKRRMTDAEVHAFNSSGLLRRS